MNAFKIMKIIGFKGGHKEPEQFHESYVLSGAGTPSANVTLYKTGEFDVLFHMPTYDDGTTDAWRTRLSVIAKNGNMYTFALEAIVPINSYGNPYIWDGTHPGDVNNMRTSFGGALPYPTIT